MAATGQGSVRCGYSMVILLALQIYLPQSCPQSHMFNTETRSGLGPLFFEASTDIKALNPVRSLQCYQSDSFKLAYQAGPGFHQPSELGHSLSF